MKNKKYDNYYLALDYYNRMIDTYVAFFIYNKKEKYYEVINQDLFDYYEQALGLDYELIDMYA